MANKYTAGYSEASFDKRRDKRSKALNYLRPKPTESGDPKREAKPKSNELAYEIKNSKFFHDVKVIVTDYDQEKERYDQEKERRESFEKSYREREDKKRQDVARQKTEREKAIESEQEKKERAGISNYLRRTGVNEADLPQLLEAKVEEKKKSKLKKKEDDFLKEMNEKYLQEALTEMDEGEVLVFPNRPGMAAALAVGKVVVSHSSIKGTGQLNRHCVVQMALDKMGYVEHLGLNKVILHVRSDSSGAPVGKMENWHGNCAEVGAVSDYLHKIDPAGRMTLEEAKAHFKKEDAETFAHRPSLSDGTKATEEKAEVPACGSCHFMLTELGIKHVYKSSSKAKPTRK